MIDFQRKKDSKRPEPAQVSVQDGEQLYEQVNKSKTNNSLAHTSHNQETIYAEVKKWMYGCSIFLKNKQTNVSTSQGNVHNQ